ncbi:MAG: hypothetical protein JXR54_04085 [Tannerellaceae bacterium]|nr:hypothetical protein [Tannerellaceae bacterium]
MKNNFMNSVSNTAVLKYEITADDLMKVLKDVIRKTTDSVIAKLNEERSPEFVTRKEAMGRLEVKSEATMINWEKKGYLVPHRIGGRIFYRQDEIVEGMERFTRTNECLN